MSIRSVMVWLACCGLCTAWGCGGPLGEKGAERTDSARAKSCRFQKGKKPMVYHVKRIREAVTIDANWDKPVWKSVEPLELAYYMGDKPEHMPRTQAKLAYDDQAIYVIFRVEDRYVRAVAERHQDMVCRDSCVEFFFTPGTDVTKGYFNLEMNCGGIMLLHYQVVPRKPTAVMTPEDLAQIQVAHSMPKRVDPEITEPTVWTVEYRLPLSLVTKYAPYAAMPAPGVEWRANFFKCADQTSKPHWLTWSYVDRPKPDFHVPECFGTLRFE